MLRIAVGRDSTARRSVMPPTPKTQFGHEPTSADDRFRKLRSCFSGVLGRFECPQE